MAKTEGGRTPCYLPFAAVRCEVQAHRPPCRMERLVEFTGMHEPFYPSKTID